MAPIKERSCARECVCTADELVARVEGARVVESGLGRSSGDLTAPAREAFVPFFLQNFITCCQLPFTRGSRDATGGPEKRVAAAWRQAQTDSLMPPGSDKPIVILTQPRATA